MYGVTLASVNDTSGYRQATQLIFGTGKRLFLRYALAKALKEKHPVALCERPKTFLLFDGRGVNLVRYDHFYTQGVPFKLLALFDTCEGMETPVHSFWKNSSQAYVIHPTSPKLSRYKEWIKQIEGHIWPTQLWTAEEMKDLRCVSVLAFCPHSNNVCDQQQVNQTRAGQYTGVFGYGTVQLLRAIPASLHATDYEERQHRIGPQDGASEITDQWYPRNL